MMNREQTIAAMKSVEADYREKLKAHRKEVLRPVLKDLRDFNALARQVKARKLKKLTAWLEVLDGDIKSMDLQLAIGEER